ncbi:MAG TPA: thioredoxin domain-containing protein [Rhodanobacteraceae bacterium]|nr:thioredoxin domain-containing protein [Rhodanobacteraceae bacterium]
MSNRLAAETSPYLRQHAANPVDWWPWSAAALAEARAKDKPILLSIGYSACHWCHVMAHESFEDEATARVMNDLFVNIKVDREERPDLDKIYQLSHQALTQRGGGWPLTVFLAPDDLVPFYAGTYFPKEARYGMPPFSHVLEQVRGFWDSRRADVRTQTAALHEFLQGYDRAEAGSASALTDAPIRAAVTRIEASFDPVHGGHRGAPKFPHCPELELLLDLEPLSHRERGRDEGREQTNVAGNPDPHPALRATFSRGEKGKDMVELTLARMAAGGIHDQIGGGFCRYSVDERWEIPHFEKMLYDNAQLLPLYARCARQFDDERYAAVARELLAWLVREMVAPTENGWGGGFYTALDADSEHEEGKFYVWQSGEVRALLTDAEFAVAEPYYGFDRPANFEHSAWNPVLAQPLDQVAASLGIAVDEARTRLGSARRKLFAARSARVRPGLDDKILTSCNALMIGGIARAARCLDAAPLIGLADNALDFLHRTAWRDGRLYAKAGNDAERFPAYLDDHAFLLDALLECLQCAWSDRDIAWAIQLADALLERFEDREHGGFFFTAHDHERLPQRPKPWTDESVPCGNGVAARALLRLGHLIGATRYLDAAERTLRAANSTMQQMPQACASLLRALDDFLHPRTHIVIRHRDAAEETAWRAALAGSARIDAYIVPDRVGDQAAILGLPKYLPGGAAYICQGTRCLPPVEGAPVFALALRRILR